MAEHPATYTPTTMNRVREELRAAFRALTGRAPSGAQLANLAAHVDVETAGGRKMRGHNFGNVTGKHNGNYYPLTAPEFIDGEWVDVEQHYRWYPSLAVGAADYLAFMRRRYPTAWAALEGSPERFAEALREGEAYGWYTAPLETYQRAMRARYVPPRGGGALVPVALALGALAFAWWRART